MRQQLEALKRRQHESLGYLLIRCGQRWNERGIERVNAEAGRPVLREAHTKLLPWLQAPEGIRIVDLARKAGVTKQAVQPLVAELEREGIVSVEVDDADARARRVKLSTRGVEAMLHGTGVLEAIEAEVRPVLGRRPTQELKGLLRQLLVVLDGQPAQANQFDFGLELLLEGRDREGVARPLDALRGVLDEVRELPALKVLPHAAEDLARLRQRLERDWEARRSQGRQLLKGVPLQLQPDGQSLAKLQTARCS